MEFTEEQRKVIESVDGFNLVIACPGSGKTTTMLERIRYMIDHGIAARDITMVTFTKKAAEEMASRFKNSDKKYQGVNFSTIHSLCYRILAEENGLSKDNVLSDTEQWVFFFNKLKTCMDYELINGAIDNLINEVALIKDKLISLNDYIPNFQLSYNPNIFFEIYKDYEKYKQVRNKLDFEDMIYNTLCLFLQNKALLEKWQDKMPYIIIDEYQDTNTLQANLFYVLSSKYGNLCAVGDDDQSIYAFRSADSSIMLKFPTVFPNTKIFTLSTNYRSGSKIIDYSKNLISYNRSRYEKDFEVGQKDIKDEVKFRQCSGDAENANILAADIKAAADKGTAYKDMAVLYRINKQSMEIIYALDAFNIPVNIYGGFTDIHSEFYFKDLLAYWEFAQTEDTYSEAFLRALRHPGWYVSSEAFIGCDNSYKDIMARAKIQAIKKGRKDDMKYIRMIYKNYVKFLEFCEFFKYTKTPKIFAKLLYDDKNYHNWAVKYAEEKGNMTAALLENSLNIIIQEASNFSTMEDWLQYINKLNAKAHEKKYHDKDGVVLSTFHSAKGLEWERVFLFGIDDGIVPFGIDEIEVRDFEDSSIIQPSENLEEERRMFYVAMTRAKKNLNLYFTKGHASAFLSETKKKTDYKATSVDEMIQKLAQNKKDVHYAPYQKRAVVEPAIKEVKKEEPIEGGLSSVVFMMQMDIVPVNPCSKN